MADTGSPWNLPYPVASDLVKDGAAAIQDLAEATATGLSDAGNAGIGSNVAQAAITGTFTLASTTTFTDVTGLSVTITPTSASSKILLVAHVVLGNSYTGSFTRGAFIRFSGGNSGAYVGDSSGSRVRAADAYYGSDLDAGSLQTGGRTLVYLDSPGTTSPVTYKVQMSSPGATSYVGRSQYDNNSTNSGRFPASITAIEVKA